MNLPAGETIELASKCGFDGVDLAVRDLLDGGEDPVRLRARMNELGLIGGAWPLPVAWRGDAGKFAEDLERLPFYAEAAATLGLLRTGTWVMPETPRQPVSEESLESVLTEVAALHVERLGAIARVLDVHGVRLGLEVIGVESFRKGEGIPFVPRLADFDQRLGALWDEAPNLGILIDAFHLYAAGETVEAGLPWGVGRVVWVHVADLPKGAAADRRLMHDNDRGLPGEHAAVDCRGMLERLERAGYAGPVTAEPMPGCRSLAGLNPEATAHHVAAALHSVWPRKRKA